MKRILLVLICLAVAVSFATASGQSETGSMAGEDILTETPGSLPIVKPGNEVTLSIYTTQRPATDSYEYEDNYFTRYITDKTGLTFDWTVSTIQEGTQKLTLLMASGDYTDVIMHQISQAQQTLYSSQGILLPLDDMIDKWGVNTQKAFAQFPKIVPTMKLNDGNIYGLINFGTCVHCQVTGKLWVYDPWLESLGLNMPETTEDFYQMLKAFKEQDPNNNGKADEIPMAGSQQGWMTQIDIFLMNAFIYNDENRKVYFDNGKVVASYAEPGWKEGLKYINRLYEEGLIAPESLTQKSQQLQQMGENEGVNILGVAPGGYMGTFSIIQGDSGRWLEFSTLKPLRGPEGLQYTRFNPYLSQNIFFVTDKAENPVAAFRLGDLFYDDEIVKRAANGEEGDAWREPKAGELGLDGKPGWVYYLKTVQERHNDSWRQKHPAAWNHSSMILDAPLEHILYDQSFDNYFPYTPPVEMIRPPLIWDEVDSSEVSELQGTLETYVKEMFSRFVSGDVDIDTGWDAYINELNKIGLERYLELYQKAFDAKYK